MLWRREGLDKVSPIDVIDGYIKWEKSSHKDQHFFNEVSVKKEVKRQYLSYHWNKTNLGIKWLWGSHIISSAKKNMSVEDILELERKKSLIIDNMTDEEIWDTHKYRPL